MERAAEAEALIAQNKFGQQSRQKGRKGFFRKIAVGFGLASVMLAGVGLASYRNLTSLIQTADWQIQHYKVLDELEDIRFQMQKAAIANRYITTPEARYLKPYYDAALVISQEITDLRQRIANNPEQQRRLAALELLITRKLTEIEQTTNLRKTRGFSVASQAVLVQKAKILTDDIEAKIREMEKAENMLLARASISQEASARNTIFTFSSGIFLTFFILVAVYYFIYREISERKRVDQQVNLLQTLMLGIAECGDFDEALAVILRTVCETKGWNYGEAWIPCPDESTLTCSTAWYSRADGRDGSTFPVLEKFRRLSQEFTFPLGIGLPGRVWSSKQPEWQEDVSRQPERIFRRAHIAMECGLRAGLGIPLIVNEQVLAVLVFFKFESSLEDIRLVESISAVAAQLSSVIQRKRMEQVLRESEERFKVFMNNTPAVAFLKDEQGRYVYVNEPFERRFNVKLVDMQGKTDCDWLPEATSKQVRENDIAVLSTGKTTELLETVPTPDGCLHYWLVFKFPVKDASGRQLLGGVALDITERKQAEEALQKSQKKYQSVVDNIKEVIFQTDATGLLSFLNPAWTEITGFSIEESLGTLFVNYIHPDDRQRNLKRFQPLIERQQEYCRYQIRYLTKDGGFRWIEIYARLTLDTDDNIIGTSGTLNDITERKRTEEALAKRQLYWAALVEVQRRLLAFDGDGKCYTRILELLGLVSGASRVYLFENHRDAAGRLLMSQRAEWCETGIHPESDNPQRRNLPYDDCFPRWAEELARGKIIAGTVGEFPLDERLILETQGILSILILPLTVNGEFFGFIGFDNCVEAQAWESSEVDLLSAAASAVSLWQVRKQAESELREMSVALENAVEGIARLDTQGRYISVNTAYANNVGYKPEELIGMEWQLTVHPEDRENMMSAYQYMQSNGKVEATARGVRKDSSVFYKQLVMTSAYDKQQRFIGHYCFMKDITERKRAEEQIKASLKEKEVLLKEIHHRVKNNLQIISSLLKLQSGYIKDIKTIEIFKESQSRIRSMALIHEKLYQSNDLSRVNFAEYIGSLIANLFRSYELNSSAIKRSINVDNVCLEIDLAISCGLIINELVSNSLKYAFPSGREGEIRIDLYSTTEREFILIVSDNGIGLPKDLDCQNTKTLGLQLVNNLVEQLEGTVKINGNGGTEFRITFTA